MTAYVVNNDAVAHRWVAQSQSKARSTNRAFRFDGDDLFSYGQHIGRVVAGAANQPVALLTSSPAPPKIERHIKAAESAAVVEHIPTFRVPNFEGPDCHTKNLAYLAGEMSRRVRFAGACPNPEGAARYLDAAAFLSASAVNYARIFALIPPDFESIA